MADETKEHESSEVAEEQLEDASGGAKGFENKEIQSPELADEQLQQVAGGAGGREDKIEVYGWSHEVVSPRDASGDSVEPENELGIKQP